MKEYVREYEPKAVLWFFAEGSDLCFGKFSDDRFNNYLNRDYSQNLTEFQPEIDRILKASEIQDIAELSGPSVFGKIRATLTLQNIRAKLINARRSSGSDKCIESRFSETELCPLAQVFTHLEKILRDGKDYIRGWNGDLIFVYLPA